MTARLPVTLRKTPGGYAIQCGPDKRATLYLYVQTDEMRIEKERLLRDEAEALAKEIARALRQSWVIANKHSG